MLEYASIRLTLVCTTPTTVPTIIVAPAIHESTGIHCDWSGSNGERNTRTNAANAAALTPVDMKAVTIVGAPSYASGVHMWNGTAETLNAKPTTSSPTARTAIVAGAPAPCDDSIVPSSSRRVVPATANANATP